MPINDYRMRRGRVEFHALDPHGGYLRGELSRWRELTDYEVKMARPARYRGSTVDLADIKKLTSGNSEHVWSAA